MGNPLRLAIEALCRPVVAVFGEQYARAREDGYDWLFESTLAVATDCQATSADVAKARLITDIMKWQLSKVLPRYGDSVTLQHAGHDGGAIKHEQIDPRDLARSVLDVLAEAGEATVDLELLEAPETKH
jgi:hypothetical protein